MAELEAQVCAAGRAIREQPFPSARLERARLRFAAWERSCGIPFPDQPRVYPRFAAAMCLLLVVAMAAAIWRLTGGPAPEALLARGRQAETEWPEKGGAIRRQSLLIQVQTGADPTELQDWRVEVLAERAAGRFASRWTDAAGVLQHAFWCAGENRMYRYDEGRLRPGAHQAYAPLLERLSAARWDKASLKRTLVEWIFSREWRPVSLAGELKEFVDRTGLRLRARKTAAMDGAKWIRLELERRSGARFLYIALVLEIPGYRPRSEIIRLEEQGVRSVIYLVPGHTEWISAEKAQASWFEPSVPAPLAPHSSPAARRTASEMQRPAPPPEAVLLATEVHALEALHEARACLGEPVQIRRVPGNVVAVSGLVSSEEKKQAILARLAPLEFTGAIAVRLETVEEALNRQGGEAAVFETAPEAIEQKISSGASPIQKMLASYFRKREKTSPPEETARRITDFSNRAVVLAEAAWAEAWALRHLHEQFPDARLAQLDPPLRHILLRMAVDHLVALRRSLELARELWRDLLGEHAPGDRLPSIPDREDGFKDTLFFDVQHYHSLVHALVAGAGAPPASAQSAMSQLAATLNRAEAAVRRMEQAADAVGSAHAAANRRSIMSK